jgi:hypothetical protein
VAVPDWFAADAVAQAPGPAIGSKAWETVGELEPGTIVFAGAESKRTSPGATEAQLAAWNGRSVAGSSKGPVAPPEGALDGQVVVSV